MKNTRKGFTLVELLIVIVVIGILSAMMMLSSTEAVTSAKASNIVSNMRNIKTAALAYYVDDMDNITTKTTAAAPSMEKIWPYLNNQKNESGSTYNIPDSDKYEIVLGTDGVADSWFLKYTINGTTAEVDKIESKLEGRAKSVGLLQGIDSTSNYYTKATGKETVYMFVR